MVINDFINQQFRAITCCTNDGYLGEEYVGKEIDKSFLKQLSANIDPCGENGEYHTFCHEGPLFKKKIDFKIGEKVYKPLELKETSAHTFPVNTKTKGFWYCDLLPI